MLKAIATVGLFFGDEGKGSIVDALVRRHASPLVIRYGGGCQAAHTVITWDCKRHTFSQFGSGTLAGADTYLHHPVIIDPLAMRNEWQHLQQLGVSGIRLGIHPKCLVSTSIHQDANLADPVNVQNGTCGMGIGKTREYWLKHGGDAIFAEDLLPEYHAGLVDKLRLLDYRLTPDRGRRLRYETVADELSSALAEVVVAAVDICIPSIDRHIAAEATIIFEGAQGILLDEIHGFAPHTTWSDVTTHSVVDVLDSVARTYGCEIERTTIGVMRAYVTRHGNGPLPTETDELGLVDENNPANEHQGKMRFGWPDLRLLEYALAAQPVDSLAVNHIDQLQNQLLHVRGASWPIADVPARWFPKGRRQLSIVDLLSMIKDICPISIRGTGPTAAYKQFIGV